MRFKLIDMFFPTVCPYCDDIINFDNYNGFCNRCKSSISFSNKARQITLNDKLSVSCISSFKYENDVRKAIHRFKFRGKRNYRHMFGVSMRKSFVEFYKINPKDYDVVTFVPFSRRQRRNRAYNQAELLAKSFAANVNLPCKELISKLRDNKSQHELSATERSKNVLGVYGVTKVKRVKDKNIILCDDIITTGSTLRENTAQLLKAGAKSVICATLSDRS